MATDPYPIGDPPAAGGPNGAAPLATQAGPAEEALLHVPLDSLHRELGAKMAPFSGFDMPIQYPTGLKREHLATRTSCGLFDVSHMGQLLVRPRDGRIETLQEEL
ncbi:MAG TPA: hypothetical protein VEY69_02885, partial [Lautropia sp.]|nr:hypothetical protein [Lautropia sp.]